MTDDRSPDEDMSAPAARDAPAPVAGTAVGSRVTMALAITGRVQGVGYRWWFEGQARRYGLDGWVRNRRDGSVEALISGPRAAVQTVIRRAQDGPPAARVEAVRSSPPEAPDAPGFRRKPTV